jgi:hypothetical protein
VVTRRGHPIPTPLNNPSGAVPGHRDCRTTRPGDLIQAFDHGGFFNLHWWLRSPAGKRTKPLVDGA